jgi:hypothetical protein
MALGALCGLLLWGHLPLASSLHASSQSLLQSSSQTPSSTGLQEVFQVHQPVSFKPGGDNSCYVELLLMDYIFGESYGSPFVGKKGPNLPSIWI